MIEVIRSGYLHASELSATESLFIGESRLPETLFVTRAVGEKALWLYSEDHWVQILHNISSFDFDSKLKDTILSYLVAPAWEMGTNNGRMVLPDYLRRNVQFQQEDLILRFDAGKGVLIIN